MTKFQAAKFMNELLDNKYEKQDLYDIIDAFEDMLGYVIATEDKFRLGNLFEISGYTKAPWRITGYYNAIPKVGTKNGYSDAKMGSPAIKWLKDANYTVHIDPEEYFNWPENRYTTKARQFRKDRGLPEIAEFAELSEEKIHDLNLRADAEQIGRISDNYGKYLVRQARVGESHRQELRTRLQEEDLQEQRDAGVAEEDLVHHTHEEIIAKLKARWVANRTDPTRNEEFFLNQIHDLNPYLDVYESYRSKMRRQHRENQEYLASLESKEEIDLVKKFEEEREEEKKKQEAKAAKKKPMKKAKNKYSG